MPSDTFAERILRFIQAKGYKPQRLHELGRAIGVGEDELGDFHAACKALMKSGRIVLGSQNALMLPAPPGRIIGTFRGNPRGFGFVVPDTPNAHGDLYVPPGRTGDAMTGDTVTARVVKRGKRAGKMVYEGRIVGIVARGQSRFVGELQREFGRWFVVPDGHTFHLPIMVGDPRAKDARTGDQVVVEITQYPSPDVDARGVIAKVLGRRGQPGVDTLGIIEQYQLPGEFDPQVLDEAHRAAVRYDPRTAAKEREDLRKLTTVTIDPADARDFDDAISVVVNRDGTMELGVHIADVAHFVHEGGVLDGEAKKRSNSVYLPGTVIPMLPETLSNGVCSLQERQSRLAKSAFMTYGQRGQVKKTRVANTIIRSTKRLTYEQASAVLGGKRGRTSARVVALLQAAQRLAKRIRARRLREGMLELDLPETELVYDDSGNVTDVKPADDSFSHKIIEMFMVEANEAVARLLTGKKVPHLRRIHAEPRREATSGLRRFLALLGYELPADADRFALQSLLKKVRGKGGAFAVNLAVLRTMQQAEYAPLRVGHFALASRHYCHFTSPIRRYPDLTIHRLIDLYVRGSLDKPRGVKQVPTEEDLVSLGTRCSTRERRAEAAERELKLVLVLRLLEKRLGHKLSGIVTGVANVGVFVQLERYLVEGLLRFGDLLDDWWEVDPTHGCVIGQRSGHRITVGDRLDVVIGKIHLPTRQLDLALARPLKGARGAKPQSAGRTRETTVRGVQPGARQSRARRGMPSRATQTRRRAPGTQRAVRQRRKIGTRKRSNRRG